MKNNQAYKNDALAALKGNWAPAVVCSIAVTTAVFIILAPSYCANMASLRVEGFAQMNPQMLKVFMYIGLPLNLLLLYPLILGYTVAHNELLIKGDNRLTTNTFRMTFSGYFRNVWGMFLMWLFTILWSLLLIIPGIVKSFAYALTPFILKDYPELSANQAINLSIKMMKGHKFDLFWLLLSFLGWLFLCLLTLGIGVLWFMPYWQTALASFYQDVKNNYLTNNNN